MLIFLRHNLTYLATPKTGTTAVEMALKPRAEIVFAKNRKHLNAARYANKVAPFLEDTFGVCPPSVAVMRDPVDQIRSWYKYRQQDRHIGTPVSTHGISFDQYALEIISDDPPERARIGRQFTFLTDGKDRVMVNHLFAYEQQELFLSFLSERLETPVKLEAKNVSPPVEAEVSKTTREKLRASRASDFALYEEILRLGGQLQVSA